MYDKYLPLRGWYCCGQISRSSVDNLDAIPGTTAVEYLPLLYAVQEPYHTKYTQIQHGKHVRNELCNTDQTDPTWQKRCRPCRSYKSGSIPPPRDPAHDLGDHIYPMLERKVEWENTGDTTASRGHTREKTNNRLPAPLKTKSPRPLPVPPETLFVLFTYISYVRACFFFPTYFVCCLLLCQVVCVPPRRAGLDVVVQLPLGVPGGD